MITLVARRALLDYARRPLNVVLLVAVPVVIVVALSGELAAFSKLLSTSAQPLHLDVATAGWAAAAVAGLAGFFQVVGSRDSDRRLAVVSSRGAPPVVVGRLVASAGLALAAAAAAIAALAVKGGVADPARAILAVVLVSIMYVAIGVLTGTLVRSEMNGALVVSVIWTLDVFVGSGLGGNSSLVARVFPLHFPTMILTSQGAHHGGPMGDVGWSLLWTALLASSAVARLASTTRSARHARLASAGPASSLAAAVPPASTRQAAPAETDLARAPVLSADVGASSSVRPRRMRASHLAAALWADVRQYRRNRVLWVLLAAVPALFVALAAAQTPTSLVPVSLIDGARHLTAMVSMRQIHAGEMAGVASALLAGIAGLFVVTGSAPGDRRLVLAGFRPRQVLVGHLGVIVGAAVATSAVSLAVSALFFSPQLWAEYAGAGLLIALTYAMIGVLLGPLTGRLGGLYVILLLAIVDTGYGQTVMFHPLPPTWGAFLPGHGAGRLLLDGSFTRGFEQYGSLALALAWLAGLTAAAVIVFELRMGAKRARPLAPDGAVPIGRRTGAAPLSSSFSDNSAVSYALHGLRRTWGPRPTTGKAQTA